MGVVNLRQKTVPPGPAIPVDAARANALVKTGRWEIAPGEPRLPIGCPAELAQRAAREEAVRAADAAAAKKAAAARVAEAPAVGEKKAPATTTTPAPAKAARKIEEDEE